MLCFVFAALVVLLDQLFKRWIVLAVEIGAEKGLIPGLLGLTHVQNYGAAFSILEGKRWLLAVVMFVCVILIISILLRYNEGFWGTLGLAGVLGGAVGNLIDRVFQGYVVDMFEFRFMNFAIFNIADIFITMGGLTFIVFFIVTTFKSEKDEKLSEGLSNKGYSGDDYNNESYTDEDYYGNQEYAPESARGSAYEDDEPEYEYIENYDELFNSGDSIGSDVSDYVYEEPAANDEPDIYKEPAPPPVVLPAERYENEAAVMRTAAKRTAARQTDEFKADGRLRAEQVNAERKNARHSRSEPAPDSTPILAALDELESELAELEDYDVDRILREYGFEEDND